MEAIRCSSCGEQEALLGTRSEKGPITITCASCGHEWVRDPDVCPQCGRRAIANERVPMMQKARGTQQSIVAYRTVQVCIACGYRQGDPDPDFGRTF